MTTEGWIFMVGFRVFDIGLLILWLVWFFRLRDDDDGDDGPGGGGPDEPRDNGPGGGGLDLPFRGRARPGRGRVRDHEPAPHLGRRRGPEPIPRTSPARSRRRTAPLPIHHGS
jgi:hypothetical protein